MVRRAEPSGITLNEEDAALVKGMLARGDRQHDIAAFFGVNGGRIAEIARGMRFRWVTSATAEQLPPPGPYLSPKKLLIRLAELNSRLEKLEGRQVSLAARPFNPNKPATRDSWQRT